MRKHVHLGLLCLTAVALQCSKLPFEKFQRLLPFKAAQTEKPYSVPDYDSLFTRLIDLKTALGRTPADTFLIRMMLDAAVDRSENNFFAIGMALPRPADEPDSIRHSLQLQEASRDGESCALYLKAWQKGSYLPYGKRIFGKILYRKILLERHRNDTVFQLIKIPSTSVVLE